MPDRGDHWTLAAAVMVGVAALAVVVVAVTTGPGKGPVEGPAPSAAAQTQQGPERLRPPLPLTRTGAAIAYDAFRHQVVLFGGSSGDPSQVLNETWTLRGRQWTERNPQTRPEPGPSDSGQMAYDDQSHNCLLVESHSQAGPAATWTWDGTTWTRVADVPLGGTETFQALVSDPISGHVLLLSDVSPPNSLPRLGSPQLDLFATHTWTWDGRTWTLRHPAQPFPVIPTQFAGSGPALASIGVATPGGLGRGVLAVLEAPDHTAHTWLWDGSTWSQQAAAATPPHYPVGATMAEDAASRDVVLIGWGDGSGDPGATWLWDGRRWRHAGPAPFVDFLYGGASVLLDGVSGHAIVIGDRTPGGQPNQFDVLWTWIGRGWLSDRPA
jgi:hypothetical protein